MKRLNVVLDELFAELDEKLQETEKVNFKNLRSKIHSKNQNNIKVGNWEEGEDFSKLKKKK